MLCLTTPQLIALECPCWSFAILAGGSLAKTTALDLPYNLLLHLVQRSNKPRHATITVLCASTAPTLLLQVTLIHVYQAGMFADLIQIAEGASAAPGEKVSSARSALQQEVQQKLLQLPAAVLQKAQQVRFG